jgi:NAD(P)-dependent dehydrogenase (short-subunit alcohol dehydrogenase family)
METLPDSPLHILRGELLKKYDFHEKTAVVTGGGSGLGRRIGTVLASLDACVVFADLNDKSAREAAENAGPPADWLAIDVSDPNSVRKAFQKVVKERGRCDILVCSAGISGSSWIEEMEFDRWKRVLDVNLTGTFLCCQAVVRKMIDQNWGRIVNIASIASRFAPWPKRFNGAYNYSASKAGVVAMSRRLAVELAPYNITVNCISPGITKTPLTEKSVSDKEVFRQIIDHVPLRRLGKVEDLDGLIMYLCSDHSEYLTGQEIFLDGGYSLW